MKNPLKGGPRKPCIIFPVDQPTDGSSRCGVRYNSVSEAARAIGVQVGNLNAVLLGYPKRRSTGGYSGVFLQED